MNITPIKTSVVRPSSRDLHDFIAEHIGYLRDGCVLSITSKVISLCEGNIIPIDKGNKDEIIEKEADLFLPKTRNKYGVYLTIKRNMIVPSAGVDESNSDGNFILWPKDPQSSANKCWSFLRDHYKLRNVGILITDSTSAPLRWGVTGKCIAYCGFAAINSKIGQPDVFGRVLRMTKINVADALAAAAVLCMGEANEQTPLALIEDIPFVKFSDSYPNQRELEEMKIDLDDDLYSQLLKSVKWQRSA